MAAELQQVVVTNAVDVNTVQNPVHAVVDGPFPLPITLRTPVEFTIVGPAPAGTLDYAGWLTGQLNGLGAAGWRAVGTFSLPAPAMADIVILQRDK